MAYRFALFLIRFVTRLLVKVEAEGLENLPAQGPFIVVSNHLGRFDVPLPYVLFNRQEITMMVAEKYQKYAIIRWFVKQLHDLFVDRYNADLATVRIALNRLKQGGVLIIAPEGTRSKSEGLIEARSGASYLAAKSGVPIIPVGIAGSEDRLIKHELMRLRRARIHVRMGKPFSLPPIKGTDKEAVLQAYTSEMMCQIAALLPPKNRGFYAGHARTRELLKLRDNPET